MTLTLKDAYEKYIVFNSLKNNTVIPLRISYWIAKNLKILAIPTQEYLIDEQKILDKYLAKDKEGKFIIVHNEDNTDEYQILEGKEKDLEQKLNDLSTRTAEIEPYLLNISNASDFNISPQDLDIIFDFIEG